jgi:hypothetical protein
MNIIGIGLKIFSFIINYFFKFYFSRAIDLTQRHPQYLEIVVGYRQKYLKDYGGGKKETNQKYAQAMKNVGCLFLLFSLYENLFFRLMLIGIELMQNYEKN